MLAINEFQRCFYIETINKKLIGEIGDVISTRADTIVNACRTIGQRKGLDNHKYSSTFICEELTIIAVFTCFYVEIIEQKLGILNIKLKHIFRLFMPE